jgi:hypothetical protein
MVVAFVALLIAGGADTAFGTGSQSTGVRQIQGGTL